jgi:hypothetical protein
VLQTVFGRCLTGISPDTIAVQGEVRTVHTEKNTEKISV